MVQISCRSSDVAASGGVFDRPRPRSRRSSKSGTTALTGTSSQAGAIEPAAVWSVDVGIIRSKSEHVFDMTPEMLAQQVEQLVEGLSTQ